MASVDLVGNLYGRLTVRERLENVKGRTAYRCICSCGNSVDVLTQSLKSGATKSCGCLHKEASSRDLSNTRFGSWVALSKTNRRCKKGYVYWDCMCDCGVQSEVSAESLLNGRSTRCIKCKQVSAKLRFCIHGHDTDIWGRSENEGCRACIRDKHLRTHYGISIEEFNKIYECQGGKCAICGRDLGEYRPGLPGFGNGTRIEVDHDHKLGKRVSVRGLLCGGRWAGCNRRLGRVDNPDWLEKVLKYLHNPPAHSVTQNTKKALQ